MIAYGWEQHARASSPARRFVHRVFGTYDLGARVRYAAIEQAFKEIEPPSTIFDAGSGRGQLAFAMNRRWPQASIVGYDMENELVAHARELQAAVAPHASIKFEARTLPGYVEGAFDLVTCVDVLEHVEDDAGFLRCLYDITRSGGTLILHTPAAPQRRYLADFEEQHDHVRDGYTAQLLDSLILGAGYESVNTKFTFGPLGAIGWEGFALARQGHLAAKSVLPLWYALSAIDGMQGHRKGNGLLAVAHKR